MAAFNLKSKIEISLAVNDSDKNRKKWAEYIITKGISLSSLIPIIESNQKSATRFLWMIGDICEMKPEIIIPSIEFLFSKRCSTKINNYNRSIAKIFFFCGIPENIEGDAVDELFKWIRDPDEIVTTKVFSLKALVSLSEKYNDLKPEIISVIKDQYYKNSISFKICCDKILLDNNYPLDNV